MELSGGRKRNIDLPIHVNYRCVAFNRRIPFDVAFVLLIDVYTVLSLLVVPNIVKTHDKIIKQS